MDYWPGKPEDFFPAPFSFPFRFPPERENGPGKWRLQVETFVRKDRTLLSTPIPSSPYVIDPSRPPRHIHLQGPFNVGNGHKGIQIPKLL